eukprot:scaffold586_cov155-Amphora_coffeaeformis.AAC.10
MSSRGLPGFLRRTLRVDYSFDEDEDNNHNTTTTTAVGDETAEQPPSAVNDGDSSSDHADNDEEEISFEQTLNPPAFLASSGESTTVAAGATPTTETIHNGGSSLSSYEVVEPPESNTESTESPGQRVARKYPSSTEIEIDLQPEPPQATPRSYREVQFDKVMSADVINMEELRKLAWNGIPSRHRAAAWKILLGYLPTNQSRRAASLTRKRGEYRDAVRQHYDIDDDTRTAQEQETLRQVLVDVPRTAPEVALFRNERIRRILARLLYVWAMRHPASSYVQGINDLATPLLVVFLADYYQGEDVLDGHVMNHLSEERLDELEADVYWCLTNLLSGIQDHYTSDQPGVQRMVMRLEELVRRIDADLCTHLEEMGVQFLQFSFRWMNCLLLREFDLRCVVRLWDTYISEKDGFEGFHVYVCAAFLCQYSPQLQAMTFDEALNFFQNAKDATQDWTDTEIEMLLSQSFVLNSLFGSGQSAHLTSGNAR